MRFFLPLIALTAASPLAAEAFERPVPQAQTATAEFWFALGSIGLIAALVLVQRLVARS
ncbi:protein NnrT [Thalassorhabdomicrobium marinisediminis]|uniref:Protein NnrT n=1 Tax=Thalassorhabdomicrobium marinisediminis TaxID=2170577 RepID=A0A2T7FTF8_9RHOB|nr:protein NnrT [Thalassorhabdomicrobium marinisediminis]PVA05422.1 protein NnrT [Thalassorhabdomicrobium marinisediminis]